MSAHFLRLASLALLTAAMSTAPAAAVPGAAVDSLLHAPFLDRALLERAALEANPGLAAARAAAAAGSARADAEGRWAPPMVEAAAAPRSFGRDELQSGYRVGVSLDIPYSGLPGLRRTAAASEARGLAQDSRTEALELLARVRGRYFELERAAVDRDLNTQLLLLAEESRRTAVARYGAGLGTIQSPLRFESERGMLEHETAAIASREAQARADLAAALHLDSAGASSLPQVALPGTHEGHVPARQAAATTRPEVSAAEARLEAAHAQAALARRSRLPELHLEAAYDRFMHEPRHRPMLGVGLTLPFLTGRSGDEQRAAAADVLATGHRLAAARDQVAAEVASTRSRVEESRHEVDRMERSVLPATDETLRAARSGYGSGASDLLEVYMARAEWAKAHASALRARIAVEEAEADLSRALGAPADGGGAR